MKLEQAPEVFERLCPRCRLNPRLPYHAWCQPCRRANARKTAHAAARKAQGRARLARWMKENKQ